MLLLVLLPLQLVLQLLQLVLLHQCVAVRRDDDLGRYAGRNISTKPVAARAAEIRNVGRRWDDIFLVRMTNRTSTQYRVFERRRHGQLIDCRSKENPARAQHCT
ncbi:hypothetical protein ACVOMV_01585 [Mesorhizobium atlanticum]